MYLLGFSLNNLTLMALTIATGFVVDDAIVMIENIFRYLEEGETPLNAALKGAKHSPTDCDSVAHGSDRSRGIRCLFATTDRAFAAGRLSDN